MTVAGKDNRARRVLARVGGFAASTLFATVVNATAIPVLIAKAGADDWSNLAIGQAVGTVFAVVVAFGWGVTGPASVAVLGPADTRAYYLQSIRIRAVLLLISVVPSIAVTLVAVHGEHLAATLTTLTLTTASLGGTWYYVGRGRPRALFFCDTAPRVVSTIVGLVLVLLGADLAVYSATQLIIGSLQILFPILDVLRMPKEGATVAQERGLRAARHTLAGQVGAVVVAATGAFYVSAPLIAVGVFVPGQSAVFAVGDRILKFCFNVLSPTAQAVQSWVPDSDRAVLAQRSRVALKASVGFGVVGAVFVAFLLWFGAPLLTGGQVHLDPLLILALAGSFPAIAVSRIAGFVCLVAFDRIRALAVSTVAGAIAGLAALAILTPTLGAVGAAIGFFASEVAVTVSQVVSLRRALREHDGPVASAGGEAAYDVGPMSPDEFD